MTKLFISYRRADSQHAVDRLYEALRKRLAKKDIFIDVDNIPKGVDFADHLARHVGQCETLLAIIGPQWLNLADEAGRRRLDIPDDFVRIEIAAALKRNIPVVPVLLDGTPMPRADQLPADLRGFERRNAAFLSRDSFRGDMDKLIEDLGLKPRLNWQVPVIGAGAVLAAGLGGLFAAGMLPLPSSGAPETRTEPEAVIQAGDDAGAGEPEAASAEAALPASAGPAPGAFPGETAPSATLAAHRTYLADAGNVRFRAEAEAAIARHEAAVLRLQTALSAKGFAPGSVDGRAGAATVRAIEAYRAASGYASPSVDLTAIDAAPITALAASVEAWTPATTPARTRTDPVRPEPIPPPSRPEPGDVFTDCTGCPSMIVVPAGSFKMGSPSTEAGRSDDEGPQRTVTIGSDFAVGRYEVTWTQYSACVSDGTCPAAADDGFGKGSRPVTNVDWEAARKYANWLSGKTGETYRLLSEAEWEYAARGGTTTLYSFGSDPDRGCGHMNGEDATAKKSNPSWTTVSCDDGFLNTAPVGSFSRNAFGLYDMHGNVWEWTQDCWNASYDDAPKTGSAWTSGDCTRRVLRGGSWDGPPDDLRSASRVRFTAAYRFNVIGFRVARTL